MDEFISPKYQMKLIQDVHDAIWAEYKSYKDVRFYIGKWHIRNEDWNNSWENFNIATKENGDLDLLQTLHNIDGSTLLKIAIDIGVDTPDFIPLLPTFRNEIKSDYKTASATFEKAFKQVESHPDIAIGLANSALESIIKEILKDIRINSKIRQTATLYDLTIEILKVFQFYPDSDMPSEIKTIGSSLLAIDQSVEKIRSEKTTVHGKTFDDYIIQDSLYTYFIVNSIASIGLFLNSYYKKKFPKEIAEKTVYDDLPF
jgi:hypothetical protein